MKWKSLLSTEEAQLWRGVVFRFPAQYPFEEVVDFMIIEDHDSESFYKIICSSGYHSGQTEVILPVEAKHGSGGISVDWIKKNWSKWIYPECSIDKVKYFDQYPPNHGE
jgi:hypothetical protein